MLTVPRSQYASSQRVSPSISSQVTSLLSKIKEAESSMEQLKADLNQTENSMQMLLSHLSEMEEKKEDLLVQLERFHKEKYTSNCSGTIEELIEKLGLLKALEGEESDKQYELLKLEQEVSPANEGHVDAINFPHSVNDLLDRLKLLKKELGTKLRAIASLKRQYDDVPTQTELIQYERRFSELFAQIQEKHRQTRKHYDTYNALLEIKELMLKETSLLNSINSQFRDIMASTIGRSKLLDSMEVVVKGTKQKLEKVQHALLKEQRICETLNEQHAAAVAEQRNFSSLLKAFQEECSRNERLRRLTSV